jgi:hypothetical protein
MGPGYHNAGFLGAKFAPFHYNPGNVNKTSGPIPDRVPQGGIEEFDRRIDFIESLNRQFHERHDAESTQGHTAAYRGAQRLVHTDKVDAFDLSKEPESVLERYGFFDKLTGAFTKPQHETEKNGMKLHAQCLTARRLIEVGVPFVEIGGGGWDSHAGVLDGSYQDHRFMGGLMDKPVAALITDLKDCGLLDNVLIVLVGEFGRQGLNGTNHNNKAFTAVLAGAGLKTGQVIGATDKTGDTVAERPIGEHEFLATMLKALGIDPNKEYTVGGRPITLVDPGTQPVKELF